MDVGTNIMSHVPGRQRATGEQRSFVIGRSAISRSFKIFKKTPFISGLHSVSRDVVKDIPEFVSTPLLTTTRLDQDVPHGLAGAGRVIPESPTAVKPCPHQSVLRSADQWVVAGSGKRITVLSFVTGISNEKLTDGGFDARPSKRVACATNHASGTHEIFTKRAAFPSAGASSLSSGDLENHSDADI